MVRRAFPASSPAVRRWFSSATSSTSSEPGTLDLRPRDPGHVRTHRGYGRCRGGVVACQGVASTILDIVRQHRNLQSPATVLRTPTSELRSSCPKMSPHRPARHAGDLTTPEVSKIARSTSPQSPGGKPRRTRLSTGRPAHFAWWQGETSTDQSPPAARRRASRSRRGLGDERRPVPSPAHCLTPWPLPQGAHANKTPDIG